jgi:VWFA-related protein
LDVSVLDRDGNPVTDLALEDFVVSLNGEKAPLRAMVFLATHRASATTTSGRPATGFQPTSVPTVGVGSEAEPDPRLVVLMVDDVSIYSTESKGLLVAAERFVDSIPRRDWVGLTTTSGLTTVNPSPDRTLLMTRLKRTFGQMHDPRRLSRPPVGLMEALLADESETALRDLIQRHCQLPVSMSLAQILANNCAQEVQRRARDNAAFARNNTRNQLDTYAAVIERMAPAPGVKELVILTGGIALTPKDSLDFIPVAKAAAAAGVQITILMEEPDNVDLSQSDAPLVEDQRQMLQEAETLADMSGGQFFRVIGQADRFYQRVLVSASAIYRVGVDLPKAPPPDGRYVVKVEVNRPGVKAFASRYASPPPPPVSMTPEEKMKQAIRTGELSYAVPIQISAEIVSPQIGSPMAIRVVVEVPGETPGPVSGMFGIVGPDQQLRSGHRDLVRSADGKSYHLDFLVPVAAATYDLRFAVTDGSGAVGAVAQKVVVK